MFKLDLTWNRPAKVSSHKSDHILRVRLTPELATTPQPSLPLVMAIALDTSGSMHGEKLMAAKQACQSVLAQLRDRDNLSLAAFSTQVNPLLQDLVGGGEAKTKAETALNSLKAGGVTRTDLALNWLSKTLSTSHKGAKVGILITDGQATNPGGMVLEDLHPLLDLGEQLSGEGIVLSTVGLGNAANFNTAFLTNLSDRGHGAFLYADTPNSLEALLKERLSAYQAIGIDEAKLIFHLKPGVKARGFCCLRPDYLPLEETSPQELTLNFLRVNTPTDILIHLEAPEASFGESLGLKEIIDLQLVAGGLSNPLQAIASLNYSNSYQETQKADLEVEQDRQMWEMNIYSKEVIDLEGSNPRRTVILLENIQVMATKVGNSDLANQAGQQIEDLEKTGKLDAHKTTKILTTTRNLSGQDE